MFAFSFALGSFSEDADLCCLLSLEISRLSCVCREMGKEQNGPMLADMSCISLPLMACRLGDERFASCDAARCIARAAKGAGKGQAQQLMAATGSYGGST